MDPDGLPDLQLLIFAVVLVLLAGLASMTDAALASVSPARAQEMAKEGQRGANALAAVASDVVRHLNLLLLLRLLCELTATTLVALVCVETYGAGWRAALVTAGSMTLVSFVVVCRIGAEGFEPTKVLSSLGFADAECRSSRAECPAASAIATTVSARTVRWYSTRECRDPLTSLPEARSAERPLPVAAAPVRRA